MYMILLPHFEIPKLRNSFFKIHSCSFLKILSFKIHSSNTVSNSISRLKKLDEQLSDGATGLTKKERLNLEREQSKLNASLGGIREMGGTPDLLFVIDTNKEALAIQEAKKLGIPVIAVIDTNSDPSFIDYPIPGNDDARRSIDLYCNLIKDTIIAAKKVTLKSEDKKISDKKEKSDKSKTVAEIDRNKLEKKFSKKKEEKSN